MNDRISPSPENSGISEDDILWPLPEYEFATKNANGENLACTRNLLHA